tara:strand:+ start:2415 stop:3179 length:765 start_codon:yes stop_codon:yes gene_type:complete
MKDKKIRIIPSILYNKLNAIRGKNFEGWRVIGNVLQTTRLYSKRNIDELFFLDTQATKLGQINYDLIKEFSKDCFMPITIGGGIKSIEHIDELLKMGADRVCINSSAFKNEEMIKNAIKKFGRQCIVISIDYKQENNNSPPKVFINSGSLNTNINLIEYIKKIDKLNPSEVVLTSINHDGMMNGYDINNLKIIKKLISTSIIASGGAGSETDVYNLINETGITNISASSIFHFTETTPTSLKNFLKEKGLNIRK